MTALNAALDELPVAAAGELPLVLVTVGSGDGEFEALYDHLEAASRDTDPRFQSLIVARRELPDVLFHVLRARAETLPHVYVRRLGDTREQCFTLRHRTGTFLVTRRKKQRGS